MEVDEEEKEADTGNEGERVKTTIENEREEEEEEKWCLLQTQEEESAEESQQPTDTMLRLNIRCLNNQARFDPRRLPRGDEREKDRERGENKGEREKTSVRAHERERHKGTRATSKTRKRKREGEEREREKEIPVPTEWESNTFPAVPRFRSAPDPPASTSPLSYILLRALLLCQTSRRSLRHVFPLAVLTLSVYTYYAKQVTVGGLGSQTRSV